VLEIVLLESQSKSGLQDDGFEVTTVSKKKTERRALAEHAENAEKIKIMLL
jgi:hypothetical protein